MRAVAVVCLLCACSRPAERPVAAARPDCPLVPRVEDPLFYTVQDGGLEVKLEHGLAYSKSGGGDWKLEADVYSPDWFEKAYAVDAGCSVSRRADDGATYPVLRALSDDFEGASDFIALFGPERGWTAMTLQSPQTPSVSDYVALRECLMKRTCTYRDSRFELMTSDAGSFVRATSVPKGAGQQTGKASFESTLGYFVKGDDVWFRARVRLVEGVPFSFFDLESTHLESGPGPRIVLFGGAGTGEPLAMGVELKWLDKPTYRQTPGAEVAFPLQRWVLVEAHYRLDDREGGLIELWQDGVQVLQASGRTMPISDTVLDSIEVAITASNEVSGNTVLDLDDVRVGVSR